MNKAALLVALVAAGAGFGFGYLTGSSTSSEPPEISLDGGTPDGPIVVTKTLLEGSEGPSLAATAPPAARAGLETVLEALPMPTREPGNGTITGKVVTEAGEPLAGVQILCTARRTATTPYTSMFGPAYEALPLDERIERRVLSMITSTRWREVNKTEAVSGADGSFTLANIADLIHNLRATLEGWKIRPKARGDALSAKPGSSITFTASRVVGIELDVFGPDGAVPTNVRTSLKSGNRTTGGYWRPDRTLIEAKPGHYQLTVTGGAHGELRAGPIDIEITQDKTAPIRVDLTLAPVVILTVAFPEGEEMQGSVYFMKTDGSAEPAAAALKSRGKEMHTFRHMGSRAQPMSDLEEGWYAIGFSRSEAFDVIDMVQAKPGVVEHTLNVPPVPRDRYVVARVTGPDGRPVTGARIQTGYVSETESRSGGSTFSDRGNGEYMVMQDARGATRGEVMYWIEVNSATHGAVRVEYRKVAGQTIDLSLEAPGQAHFTVDGDARGTASIAYGLTENSGGQTHKCDAEGKVTIQPIQPGTYFVRIMVGERSHSEVAREKVTIRSGKNDISLALPTLYTITVRGGERQVMIMAKRVASKERGARRVFYRHTESVNGEALVDGMPAGEYTAQSGRKTATFTVPGTTVVTLEERK